MPAQKRQHAFFILRLSVFGGAIAVLGAVIAFLYYFVFIGLATADATARLEQSISPATVNRAVLDRVVEQHEKKQSVLLPDILTDPFHSFIPNAEETNIAP